MTNLKYFFIAGCLFLVKVNSFSQQQWSSKHIRLNKNEILSYIPDEKGNILPDFSGVGYYANKKPIPAIPVVKTIKAAEGNSEQVIQSAIDEVSKMPVDKNGFRGAILLRKGIYKISGTISITASGVILRGEGIETRLIATGKGQRNLITVSGKGEIRELKDSRRKIADSYVPVGAKFFTVSSTKGLKTGDRIIVFRPGTEKWIHDLQMDQIHARDSTVRQWKPNEYNLRFERMITSIDGKKIYIDNPVVMAMEDQYGGGEIFQYSFDGRINNVGIENLLCESEYANDTDEDHGWNAIFFNRIENGWAKRITSKYFGYSCVNLGTFAKNITVDSCNYLEPKSQITGGRRYSFNNDGQLNLVMNCFASEGRHDYVTGSRVCGPNVFYNCRSEKAKADIGPHHRWAVGTLFDNIITDGEINVQDRGDWGTGHGWAGVNQVIWNCTAAKAAIQDPWVSGKNYVIGLKATRYEGRLKGRPQTDWEATNGDEIIPPSLYIAQTGNKKIWNDAEQQIKILLKEVKDKRHKEQIFPRAVVNDSLKLISSDDWTSGFFPGILWFLYERTGKEEWKNAAKEFTALMIKEPYNARSHDVGFKVYNSYGNGYRLLNDALYKKFIIDGAKTLITRFNSKTGCIRSWDFGSWQYPVIIDNMMNLELLFEATKLSGDSSFYKVAVSHANTTLKNHFRDDNSSYHVVDYDTVTGNVIGKNTLQGYAAGSAWARGQAWGLYGFTMCYRETKNKKYLEQAEKIAAFILNNPKLPQDGIPYWDFSVPNIEQEPRDVSAAAIMASAFYELISYSLEAEKYKNAAGKIMQSLEGNYKSEIGTNHGFLLLQSTGHKPAGSEINVPIIYADYYYLEALLRSASGLFKK